MQREGRSYALCKYIALCAQVFVIGPHWCTAGSLTFFFNFAMISLLGTKLKC